jgi:uncharacterized protein
MLLFNFQAKISLTFLLITDSSMVSISQFEKARDYILQRLTHELSPRLTYHNLDHTVKEVVPAADRLADLEKVIGNSRLLLLTAAYYHDSGFIYQRDGHENASIQLAEQILPSFGYAQKEIAVIRRLILATCIPQSPTDLLEQIMADADLDYLGAANFWKRSEDLRSELENFNTRFTDSEWYISQLHFIQEHQYFTISERTLRDATIYLHLQKIQEKLDLVHKAQKTK